MGQSAISAPAKEVNERSTRCGLDSATMMMGLHELHHGLESSDMYNSIHLLLDSPGFQEVTDADQVAETARPAIVAGAPSWSHSTSGLLRLESLLGYMTPAVNQRFEEKEESVPQGVYASRVRIQQAEKWRDCFRLHPRSLGRSYLAVCTTLDLSDL
jgi:hypothetical protein